MKRHIRTAIAAAIVTATAGAFAYYAAHHPAVLERLRHLPPVTLGVLLLLDAAAFGCYVLVTRASLNLYGRAMGRQENILFNAYSALINFFGPGQSGPVFRGAYLKKRLGLSVKHYVFATLVYYGFFAVISVFFVCAGNRPWWQTALLALLTAAGSVAVMRWYKRRSQIQGARLDPLHIGWIGVAALLQLAAMAVIYGIELHTVGAHPTASQILSYTGVANLTVFVALTPGAIGIREGFLLFSEKLHHIDSSSIVAANVVDRGVYLLFLGVLFVLVIALHAKKKLLLAPAAASGDTPAADAPALAAKPQAVPQSGRPDKTGEI